MTITYAGDADARFDYDYYATKHMPMVAEYIGDDVVKWEVSKGIASGMGGPAPYRSIGQFWLSSLSGMKAAFKENGATIMGDIKNYTDIEAVVQIEELVSVPELVQ
jgi:uncharacterized protein (TIGR02118 family)